MPRKARIDVPGALHHIIIRGIERRRIFADDQDRDNFIGGPNAPGSALPWQHYWSLYGHPDEPVLKE